jgi:SAM-dependent methyltransferase
MDYRRHNVELLHARWDLRGRRVLEIGGDARGETARMLLDCGAREVVVTNRAHGVRNSRIDARIELRVVDARALHEAFPPDSFDAAFGVAVAEHIPDPELWTASLARVLAPGAVALVHGGPIWSGPHGHHVWVSCDGRDYHFSKPGNPLAPWQHLLHDEKSLTQALIREKGLPPSHAEAISAWVYRDPNINRIPYSALIRRMSGSGMVVAEVIDNIYRRPDEAQQALLARCPLGPDERYEVSGAAFILRKPA